MSKLLANNYFPHCIYSLLSFFVTAALLPLVLGANLCHKIKLSKGKLRAASSSPKAHLMVAS